MSARHVLLDQLAEMRLPAMARALEEQLGKPEMEYAEQNKKERKSHERTIDRGTSKSFY